MRIVILAIFLIVFGLFLAIQIPVTLTADEVDGAVSDAIAETQAPVDEDEVASIVQRATEKLEAAQRNRLKYLAGAYFVIWLVFMLYVLRLGQQQKALDQRLAQLEQETDENVSFQNTADS